MKKITLFLVPVLFIVPGMFAQINGSVNLSKGQKFAVESKVTTSSTSEMQGQSMETAADVTSVYNIEVDDVKGNNYNMTNKIATIRLNINSMGQNINFDSDKKEDMDGEMGTNMKGLINQPKTVVMDKSGNVTIEQTDSTQANGAPSQTEMILKQMGDPEQQGYGAKLAFMPIPKKVKTGTSWQDSTSADGVTRVTNYVVKEINGNTATVSISGTENRDTKMEMQGTEISTKTTGKFSGEQAIDITSGVVLQNTITMDATGNIGVMGQDIPTTIKATTVTTVKPM